MPRCIRCRGFFISNPVGHPTLFCDDCREAVRMDKDRERKHSVQRKFLGTTDFDSSMERDKNNCPDFAAEHKAIITEMRKLGVKKHGDSKTATEE